MHVMCTRNGKTVGCGYEMRMNERVSKEIIIFHCVLKHIISVLRQIKFTDYA